MNILKRNTSLYTDHYELTMAQGYFKNNRDASPAVFDYFFRKNPFNGGFTLFSGLDSFLDMLEYFSFDERDIHYLRKAGFSEEFLDYLKDFKFSGSVYAFPEGSTVFPGEPVLRVEASIIEAQLIESMLLNILNFESLIATRAARMKYAAGNCSLIDFGLRRAQGLGAVHASRAAIIGGFNATSNLLAADLFGLQSTGTMAHSWIQTYEDEYHAFSEFAQSFPDKCVFLVDTYNTLKSGIPNSIKVAHEMERRNEKLMGVRLDSGDLAFLSKQARKLLDDAGLDYVKIIVSNQMDEYIIASLLLQGAPIDGFGVGTRLVTGKPDAALDGVYKLASFNDEPRLKLSENPDKLTLPGKKNVVRFTGDDDKIYADAIIIQGESAPQQMINPGQTDMKNDKIGTLQGEIMLKKVVENGQRLNKPHAVHQLQDFARKQLKILPEEHQRFDNPHIYKVGISPDLLNLRTKLVQKYS